MSDVPGSSQPASGTAKTKCQACGELKSKSLFSKQQLKHPKKAKCAACVQEKNPPPPPEPQAGVSSQQRTSQQRTVPVQQRRQQTSSGGRGGSGLQASTSIEQMMGSGGISREQLQRSGQGTMIYYPVDTDAMMRGEMEASDVIVGHNTVFTISQGILAGRVRKMLYDNRKSAQLPEVLLSAFEVYPEQEPSYWKPKQSQAVRKQVAELRARLSGGETFTYVPLQAYYQRVPFGVTERLLPVFGCESIAPQIMAGFRGVSYRVHAHGLPRADGKAPPPSDLTAPMPFSQGLRVQCAFTPLLALMHVASLLWALKLPERGTFCFPHAFVFATPDPAATLAARRTLQQLFQSVGAGPSEAEMHCTGAAAAGTSVPYEGAGAFLRRVEEHACCLFPFFSDEVPPRLARP